MKGHFEYREVALYDPRSAALSIKKRHFAFQLSRNYKPTTAWLRSN